MDVGSPGSLSFLPLPVPFRTVFLLSPIPTTNELRREKERALCVRDQHIAILHHQRSRPREQHRSRARQDRLNRHAWLDRGWQHGG